MNTIWMRLLVLALLLGTFARVIGLGAKGLSHPEAYIPGLNLPAGISEPPPRHALVETAVWHFRSEIHPFGYYLAMWAWTKVFGTGLTSIRTPEAILGVVSIFLIYLVGASAYDTRVGAVAALMLALHGFHIFWSQSARMWVPGACLGLVSTWLLLEMTRTRPPRPGLEWAYVLTSIAGAMTIEFYWVLLSMQILWTALRHSPASGRVPRVAVVQAFAFILPAPMLSHGLMMGYNGAAPPPSFDFLRDYFAFGFLFEPGASTAHYYNIPAVVSVAILALSVPFTVQGLRIQGREEFVEQPRVASLWPLIGCAIASSAVMVRIAVISRTRNDLLMALSVLPFLALLIPFAAGAFSPLIRRIAPVVQRRLQRVTLVPLLAWLPTILIYLLSFKLTLTAPRAFAVFVPYLLLVIAAGAVAISRRAVLRAVTAVVLTPLFLTSAVMLHYAPISLRDYQGLAQVLNPSLQPGDLIFGRNKHWATTPIFYYLEHRRLVTTDYREALHRAPRARVWVLLFDDQSPTQDMAAALSDYRVEGQVNARQAEAVLYVPTH